MRTSRASALVLLAFGSALNFSAPAAHAQTAVDAAQALASAMDGAGGGITMADQLTALQDAAAAGDPMAQWQLGLMYENGEGVPKDRVKAFGFFENIANQHADAAPRGTEADIVAHSFLKMSDYYKQGLPEAGIAKNEQQSVKLIQHAAIVFGDPDALFLLGEAYLDDEQLGNYPILSAHWLTVAAKKGHAPAQAKLGDILFNGDGELEANPVEGLMWLTVASRRALDTADAGWINDLLNADMSIATPEQRKLASDRADGLEALLPPL